MNAIVRLRYAAKTDVGMKRAHNEDYFSLIEDEKVFLVADGMGGHACGEVASKLSGDVISEFYQHSKDMDATWPYRYDPGLSYPENRMVAAVRLANARIFDAAQKNPNLRGMGTTIVGCMFVGDYVYVSHVGDSRCYRVSQDGIKQLTRDHSLLQEQIDDLTIERELRVVGISLDVAPADRLDRREAIGGGSDAVRLEDGRGLRCEVRHLGAPVLRVARGVCEVEEAG